MQDKQAIEEPVESAFLTAIHQDEKLKGILTNMTDQSAYIPGDWSCCIHVNTNLENVEKTEKEN